MGRTALIYGLPAGMVTIAIIILGLELSGGEGGASSQWFGYLTMFLALTAIFFGVKHYRDQERGGVIGFGQALLAGLAIAASAGAAYVAVWEAYLAISGRDFITEYADKHIEAQIAAGVAGEELANLVASMEDLKRNLKNPLFRLPVTFTEIFPVGALISFVSAGILRRPASA
ncbi:MAG: DUF4199 domain-containing protein [Pseudomonadota bacterium]